MRDSEPLFADDGEPIPPEVARPEKPTASALEPKALAAPPQFGGVLGGPEEDAIAPAEALDASAAAAEIQAAVVMAKRFARSEDAAMSRVIRACRRPTFADRASYRYSRAGTSISGPSVYLAREMAKFFGNIRAGVRVVSDTDEQRVVRGWAWDMETNTYHEQEAVFKKLVQRKVEGRTQWVVPDERDLRELTNKQGAICMRNCLLQLMPQDAIDYALDVAKETREARVSVDPERAKKDIIAAFASLSVPVDEIEQSLGITLAQASPAQIAELREVYTAIRDGQAKWSDYKRAPGGGESGTGAPGPARGKIKTDQLKGKPESA